MVELTIISPRRVIFEGTVNSIILPGEEGVFEIQSYHKNIISRLVSGIVIVDGKNIFNIKRGVVKLERGRAMIIAEES